MGKQYKTLTHMQRDLSRIVADVLMKEVRNAIVQVWLEHQEELVYDVYEQPYRYVRRRTDGGLADPNNIETYVSGKVTDELRVILENETRGAGDKIGQLINHLIEGQGGFAGNPSEGMPARPYTEPAIKYLQQNRSILKNAIKSGFARNGIKVNIT